MSARKIQTRPSPGAVDGRQGDDSEPPGPSGRRKNPCHIRYQLLTADCRPASRGWLEKQLARVVALASEEAPKGIFGGISGEISGEISGGISIVLVDDDRMSQMHEQYSGIGGTTDVLTFDHRDDADQPLEADLVLCRDVAGREAAARGHEVRLELLLYAVHGLNHLLGGDDHTPAGAKAMHQWEDRMLAAIGFGAVFHRPACQPAKAKAVRARAGRR